MRRSDFIDILLENKTEYETFCMIKDKIVFGLDCQTILKKCIACSETTHNLQTCPRLHLSLNKGCTIGALLYSVPHLKRTKNVKRFQQCKSSTFDTLENNKKCLIKFINDKIEDLAEYEEKNIFSQSFPLLRLDSIFQHHFDSDSIPAISFGLNENINSYNIPIPSDQNILRFAPLLTTTIVPPNNQQQQQSQFQKKKQTSFKKQQSQIRNVNNNTLCSFTSIKEGDSVFNSELTNNLKTNLSVLFNQTCLPDKELALNYQTGRPSFSTISNGSVQGEYNLRDYGSLAHIQQDKCWKDSLMTRQNTADLNLSPPSLHLQQQKQEKGHPQSGVASVQDFQSKKYVAFNDDYQNNKENYDIFCGEFEQMAHFTNYYPSFNCKNILKKIACKYSIDFPQKRASIQNELKRSILSYKQIKLRQSFLNSNRTISFQNKRKNYQEQRKDKQIKISAFKSDTTESIIFQKTLTSSSNQSQNHTHKHEVSLHNLQNISFEPHTPPQTENNSSFGTVQSSLFINKITYDFQGRSNLHFRDDNTAQ